MKLAVIADIHGNAPALEAVLCDINKYDVDLVVQLGDAFNGPIDPPGVVKLLHSTKMIHIRGNGERMILSDDPSVCTGSALLAREYLNAEDLNWIASWPETFQHSEFFACHGTPQSDIDYLVEVALTQGTRLKTNEEIQAHMDRSNQKLILCAHSHVPRWVRVTNHQWILNPGSVGLPAYSLLLPFPHKMEVGSPSAKYAIAQKVEEGWSVCHFSIPYDYEKAAIAAEKHGFNDWATTIRTGYAI